ncbi:glycoside hydrolase family 16 protein [Sphaerobolus stellatus SS14]|uniref:Glycoside hydrolase family 16 protein n=1 Tax=Sphaerobolus stellatus (strain SS14) TaxID=990650 RepID=A0A0C9UWX8_SPHS4|nr:glycoside hydrolase family 16 protein [Sphaerobolus stellatus SS14]
MSRSTRTSRIPVPPVNVQYTTVPTSTSPHSPRSRVYTPPVVTSPTRSTRSPTRERRSSRSQSIRSRRPSDEYRGDTVQNVATGRVGGGYGPYAHRDTYDPTSGNRFAATATVQSEDSFDDPDKPLPAPVHPVSTNTLHYQWDVKDLDDDLHNIDTLHDPRYKHHTSFFSARGWMNIGAIVIIVVALVGLFAGYPIVLFFIRHSPPQLGFNLGGINGSGQVPVLPGLPQLIDPQTPKDALTKTGLYDGNNYHIVFSDEFNEDGRTFFPGDDPFWEAVDLNYWPTGDLEWYSPEAITTKGGHLVIEMVEMQNHDLNFRSGMLQSWNKFCFTTGIIEIKLSLPGSADTPGFWPGAWMLGNIGRAGYGATTEGTWPYSYDSCDVGTFPNQLNHDGKTPTGAILDGQLLSSLPGQKLSACTCPGSDHPGPSVSRGRGAPEIDLIEAQIDVVKRIGEASQSYQTAPYNANYQFVNTTPAATIYNDNITAFNSYKGGPFQQAVSAVSQTDSINYGGQGFQTYGIEWWSDRNNRDDGYVSWFQGDTKMWTMTAAAVGPDSLTQISQRPVSEEPMSIILNFGMSPSFQEQDWKNLKFPSQMLIDYIRVYQRNGVTNVGCSPPDYPTSDYINSHINAYMDANLTTWASAGYTFPRNSKYDGC